MCEVFSFFASEFLYYYSDSKGFCIPYAVDQPSTNSNGASLHLEDLLSLTCYFKFTASSEHLCFSSSQSVDLFFQQQYISPSDIRKRLTEYLAAPKALFMVRDPEDPSGIFIKFSNLETVCLFVGNPLSSKMTAMKTVVPVLTKTAYFF